MGYSLNVRNTNGNEYYGTKHYGINGKTFDELKKFESFQYLINLRKVNENMVWDEGTDNHFALSGEETDKFIKLYLNECGVDKIPDKLKKVLSTKGNKFISWE